MTGLTANINIRPSCLISILVGIIILAEIGTVAIGTAAVPVLEVPGPEKWVIGIDFLIVTQVKPSLPSLLLATTIPGNIKGLYMSVACLYQILLQRIVTKGIPNLKGFLLIFPIRGGNKILIVTFKESTFNIMKYYIDIFEITFD